MVQVVLVNQIQKSRPGIFKILNQEHMPADARVWIYMAVWDAGLWLNLHVLPMSPLLHLMTAFSVLGIRHFMVRALPFEHRLTSEVLRGRQYKCRT